MVLPKLRTKYGAVLQDRKAHGLEELRDMKKAMTATAAAFAPPDVSASGASEYKSEEAW